MQDADDVLVASTPERQAGVRRGQHLAHDGGGRQVHVDQAHARAVNHDVLHREIVEVEQAAEHVALGLGDAALLVEEIDLPAQLLGGREHVAILAEVDAEQPQQRADEGLDRHGQRAEQGHDPGDRLGHGERHPIREVDRHGLGQNLREHDDDHRHDDRGVDDSDFAEDPQEDARGERGRQRVHHVVADENAADQAFPRREKLGDHAGADVAALLQRVHPRPRRRCERRLRSREEPREDEAGRNPQDGDPKRRIHSHSSLLRPPSEQVKQS